MARATRDCRYRALKNEINSALEGLSMKRLFATGLLCHVMLFGSSESAHACAVPLKPYDTRMAAAAITATVDSVRGSGFNAIYRIRRTAIIMPASASPPLPSSLQIRMANYVAGTCGPESPPLSVGDRIVLYFQMTEGKIVPSGWAIL